MELVMRLMSPRKAAKELGISERMIRAMIRDGECPGFWGKDKKSFYVDIVRLSEKLHDAAVNGHMLYQADTERTEEE